MKAKSMWNGKINAIHVGYIEMTIKFQVFMTAMDFSKFRGNWRAILPQLWPLAYIIVFPFFELACIYFFRNRLNDPAVKGKIGKMWGSADVKKGWIAIVNRQVQLLRSMLFIIWPIIFWFSISHQIMFLISTNLVYLMYYGYVGPEGKSSHIIEAFNQAMLVIASYNLICYTFFVLDAETRFRMGYSFVLTITIVLGVNIAKLFWGMVGK
jgi:hypothetical protein